MILLGGKPTPNTVLPAVWMFVRIRLGFLAEFLLAGGAAGFRTRQLLDLCVQTYQIGAQ
jgi:hypothetical protein